MVGRMLVVALLAIALGAGTVQAGTIEFWLAFSDTTPQGKAIKLAIDRFEVTQPGTKVAMIHSLGQDKIITSILAGTQPDIVQLQGNWIISWARRGLLEPVALPAERAGISLTDFWPPLLP